MTEPLFRIAPARSAADIAAAAALLQAYPAAIGIDLSYQDFAGELAGLPGAYAPPGGELLLARGRGDEALGCVALRPLGADGICEMKRLYVDPAGRGIGLGRALAVAIVGEGRRIGYRALRLDTLPTLGPAIGLYRDLGFVFIPAYYDTPVAGTLFLGLDL